MRLYFECLSRFKIIIELELMISLLFCYLHINFIVLFSLID